MKIVTALWLPWRNRKDEYRRMYQVKVLYFVSVVCYYFLHAATAAVVTLA